jgi:hypothetical protein
MADDWIVIPKWNRYQHYKKRDVPWIKDYCAQLHNAAYRELSFAQRGLLHDLRLLYALSHKQLPMDSKKLASLCGERLLNVQLERLNHAGFIDIVSREMLGQSSTTYYSKSESSPATQGGDNSRELEPPTEPLRDPDALLKLQAIRKQVFGE